MPARCHLPQSDGPLPRLHSQIGRTDLRIAEEFARRSLADDPAVFHDVGTTGYSEAPGDILLHKKDRYALFVDPGDHPKKLCHHDGC